MPDFLKRFKGGTEAQIQQITQNTKFSLTMFQLKSTSEVLPE